MHSRTPLEPYRMHSYLHKFHAGNFADVHKHIALIGLLEYLKKKDKPFGVLDAFAGEGLYQIDSKESQLNKEHVKGSQKLLTLNKSCDLLQHYISLIKEYSQENQYPGSPAIIAHLLREQDHLQCVENHPSSFSHLKEQFGRYSQVTLHKRDALEAMPALMPFKEKRGLVLVDPSYELKTDYQNVAQSVIRAYEKMPNTVFLIWYPILKEERHIQLLRDLKKSSISDLWVCEWEPFPNPPRGLLGSGLAIINKGWQFDKVLNQAFYELNNKAYPKAVWRHKTLKSD